jgi:hypothetical protein
MSCPLLNGFCYLRQGEAVEPRGQHDTTNPRYKADPSGVQAMCAYLVLRDKVSKPLLAAVSCVPLAERPKSKPGQSALRQAP